MAMYQSFIFDSVSTALITFSNSNEKYCYAHPQAVNCIDILFSNLCPFQINIITFIYYICTLFPPKANDNKNSGNIEINFFHQS